MARWPAGGSGRYGRGLGVGVACWPAQPVAGISDEGGEQVLDLVVGQLAQPGRRGIAGLIGQRRHDQEGVGEHRQGGPAAPG